MAPPSQPLSPSRPPGSSMTPRCMALHNLFLHQADQLSPLCILCSQVSCSTADNFLQWAAQ